MNNSQYRFTLDLQKHQSQMSIAVFKNDTAIRLCISLTDGGKTYFIEDGCTAFLHGRRADEEPLIHRCMIKDNTEIIYDFEPTISCVEGIVKCNISLYGKDGKLITAPRFIVVVDERLVTDNDIDINGASPISALDQILGLEEERAEAEKRRAEAELARVNAEIARNQTIAEKLASMKNESAYELYKKYHPEFTGTEEEWVASLGVGITDAEKAEIVQIVGANFVPIKGVKGYAETQGILKTIEDAWYTRKSGGGLDIVDGWNTELKSIAYPANRTDGKPIYIEGIRSNSKNLLSLTPTNEPNFAGAEIEWTIDDANQSLKLKGVNTRPDRDFYVQFTIHLTPGTYYLRGCPWQSSQDNQEVWRTLPCYIYIKRQGSGYKSISTDYGTPLSGGEFTIAEDEADKYDIRCVVRAGASVDATLYPSVTQYEDTYWIPQDHYTLQPNGYFDIESSSEFSSKSYKVWRDGMEVIIGDGEVTVTQSYYINLGIDALRNDISSLLETADEALDAIIAIQESLIGGASE